MTFVRMLARIVLMDSVESTSGVVGSGCDDPGVGPCRGSLWWSGRSVASGWTTGGRRTLLRSRPTSRVASLMDCKASIFFYTHIVLNLNLLGLPAVGQRRPVPVPFLQVGRAVPRLHAETAPRKGMCETERALSEHAG